MIMGLAAASAPTRPTGALRHDWTRAEIAALFALPLPELMFRAQAAHRLFFDPTVIQIACWLSIKTGGCPEDCGYCPQAARYHTGVLNEPLMSVEEVVAAARTAQEKDRAGSLLVELSRRLDDDRQHVDEARDGDDVLVIGEAAHERARRETVRGLVELCV